ncbi:unnamed protein product [Fraxinus pennsylvanica]|uniref:WIBG Mago-binding domain-containing protein n=1 Tax=Fraxinus pennsylvanica TaxID=56036 RepID=A0AAD1ZCI4_9LAMI|nr:unnamed protein product [Fraxinus pennsylvanica]
MATSRNGRGGEEEASQFTAELGKTLKEGERLLAPTRRPDGSLRKPVRIRAGYTPQDEVAIYQSRGALWRKEVEATQEVPPGYDSAVVEAKPKSKSAKRNERKKEKRQQLNKLLVVLFSKECIVYNPFIIELEVHGYAYSDGKGDEIDDEETESLCRETSEGISLVKQDRKDDSETSDPEEETEECKRE